MQPQTFVDEFGRPTPIPVRRDTGGNLFVPTMPTTTSGIASSPVSGRTVVTTSGTPVPLSGTQVFCSAVAIVAETDNTGVIAVGDQNVKALLATRTGYPLNAGDPLALSGALDLSKIYLDSTVNGDGVTYLYVP